MGNLISAGTIRRLREVPSPLLLIPSTLLNDMKSKIIYGHRKNYLSLIPALPLKVKLRGVKEFFDRWGVKFNSQSKKRGVFIKSPQKHLNLA